MEVKCIDIRAETLHIFNSFEFQLLSPNTAILNSKSSIFNSEFLTPKPLQFSFELITAYCRTIISLITVISKFALTVLSQTNIANKNKTYIIYETVTWESTDNRWDRSYMAELVLHNVDETSGVDPFVISIAWRQSCQGHVQLPQVADTTVSGNPAFPFSVGKFRKHTREYVNRQCWLRLRLSSLSDIPPVSPVFSINKVPDKRKGKRERERELVPLGHEWEHVPPCDDTPDYLRSKLRLRYYHRTCRITLNRVNVANKE